jgi:hypothetical protein
MIIPISHDNREEKDAACRTRQRKSQIHPIPARAISKVNLLSISHYEYLCPMRAERCSGVCIFDTKSAVVSEGVNADSDPNDSHSNAQRERIPPTRGEHRKIGPEISNSSLPRILIVHPVLVLLVLLACCLQSSFPFSP